MSFMTCELRCHILDRQDQLESVKSLLKVYDEMLKEKLEKIEAAKAEHEKLKKHVDRRKKFISLVESTLDQQWIDRPDVLEKEWFAAEDAKND